ncbi:MAG: hypothetical protein NWE96_07255 [Candidatus Bathyarchaeota archaeon]|nr:hypothetical protein [Candidatus Bathyarchaeota archaeon]
MRGQNGGNTTTNQNLGALQVQGFWRSWFEVPNYGREVFNGDRSFLTSSVAFEEYIAWCMRNRAPAWMSVQPFNGRNMVSCVEKLFFDFDSKDLSLAWKEANTLATVLQESYGVKPLVCFSGSKGYHVYVWLQKTEHFDSAQTTKVFYKTAQELLLKGLSFQTLDSQVLGDIKRLARVPYTLHEKSLKPCTPVNMERKSLSLNSITLFKEQGLAEDFCGLCQSNIQQQTRRHAYRYNSTRHGQIRPCIDAALCADLSGAAGHSMRIAIATEFLNRGFSAEQTAELFRNQTDYSFEKSLYYIRDISTRTYRPYKCATIRKLGFCLKNCSRRNGKVD